MYRKSLRRLATPALTWRMFAGDLPARSRASYLAVMSFSRSLTHSRALKVLVRYHR